MKLHKPRALKWDFTVYIKCIPKPNFAALVNIAIKPSISDTKLHFFLFWGLKNRVFYLHFFTKNQRNRIANREEIESHGNCASYKAEKDSRAHGFKVARYSFHSLCARAITRFLGHCDPWILVNLNCTDNYDAAKIKMKSVTDHQ